MCPPLVRLGGTLALLVATVLRADAQGIARSFDQLQLLVRSGDTITVQDSAGKEFSGTIDSITASLLTLQTSVGRRELREADVGSIRQRRSDSLANGAIWGLVGGAAFGGTMAAIVWQDEDSGVRSALGIALFSGVGVGIGVGVDSMIAKHYVIYQKPKEPSGVTISPLVSSKRKGVQVTMAF